MKIYAGRREDILKQKEEYEADKSARQAKYDKQYSEYRNAKRGFFEGIEDIVRSSIGPTSLNLRIDVDHAYGEGLRVTISDEDDKFNEDKALAWNYRANVDKDGNVQRETSSWSGLHAVTSAALDNLKEIVRVLDKIKDIDWENILKQVGPRYDDYVTESNPQYDRNAPDFDSQLRELDIEDAIGKDVAIRGISGSGKYYRSNNIYKILKESPTQYTVDEGMDWNDQIRFAGSPYRINKAKFLTQCLPKKIETISLEKGE